MWFLSVPILLPENLFSYILSPKTCFDVILQNVMFKLYFGKANRSAKDAKEQLTISFDRNQLLLIFIFTFISSWSRHTYNKFNKYLNLQRNSKAMRCQVCILRVKYSCYIYYCALLVLTGSDSLSVEPELSLVLSLVSLAQHSSLLWATHTPAGPRPRPPLEPISLTLTRSCHCSQSHTSLPARSHSLSLRALHHFCKSVKLYKIK